MLSQTVRKGKGPKVAPELIYQESEHLDETIQESEKITQSGGLSKRLTQMYDKGRCLNDDSQTSEGILSETMVEIIQYATEIFKPFGYTIKKKDRLTLYECQEFFHMIGGPEPDMNNKKVYMKPDGGILFAEKDKKLIPILITEDKVQGTNDNLFEKGEKRQATGNAIERGGKNIRGAEMIFAEYNIFPYVIFASGCDFHSSETIAKRIEMMNMGVPNHYIEISPDSTKEIIDTNLTTIISNINIKKVCGIGKASVFIKAHKWDQMKHGSSSWKKYEQIMILKATIDKVLQAITNN